MTPSYVKMSSKRSGYMFLLGVKFIVYHDLEQMVKAMINLDVGEIIYPESKICLSPIYDDSENCSIVRANKLFVICYDKNLGNLFTTLHPNPTNRRVVSGACHTLEIRGTEDDLDLPGNLVWIINSGSYLREYPNTEVMVFVHDKNRLFIFGGQQILRWQDTAIASKIKFAPKSAIGECCECFGHAQLVYKKCAECHNIDEIHEQYYMPKTFYHNFNRGLITNRYNSMRYPASGWMFDHRGRHIMTNHWTELLSHDINFDEIDLVIYSVG